MNRIALPKLTGRHKELLILIKDSGSRLALAVFCSAVVAAMTAASAYLVKPAVEKIFEQKDTQMLMLIVFGLAHGRGSWTVSRLLLTGIVIAAGWGAVISFLLALSPAQELRGMLFWLMGDLGYAGRPLAGGLVLLGGLTTSTILTVTVIPVVYTLVDDATSFVRRVAAESTRATGRIAGDIRIPHIGAEKTAARTPADLARSSRGSTSPPGSKTT